MDPRRWLKLVAPLLASMGGLLCLRLLGPHVMDQRKLSGWLQPLGDWAPAAFILFLTLRPVTLLPGQVFTAVGGLLFGTVAGTVYALLGSFGASIVTYSLARWLGRGPFQRMAGEQYRLFKLLASRHSFSVGLVMCMNPFIPTDLAIAAAAASGARFLPLALGVLVGTIPGTIVTTLFGSSLGQGKAFTTGMAAAGMVVSVIVGALVGRRMIREAAEEAAEAERQDSLEAQPTAAPSGAAQVPSASAPSMQLGF